MRTVKDCALIPAYNEERTIIEVVTRIKKAGVLPIVIDDNSSDRTSELAEKSGAVVISQSSNMGKGEAIRAGIEHVLEEMPKIENFIFIDADMQYDPSEATLLLDALKSNGCDIVMGFRDWSSVPLRHRLGNLAWRLPFNILFGTDLKDTNCGFIAMTKKAAKKIRESLYGGYIIENAMLARAVKNNMRIVQVPVRVTYKSKSDVGRGIRMVGGILIFIVKEGLNYRLGRN